MEYIKNLLAFGLPIAIFIFWGTVGYAALTLLYTQRNLVRNLLLAPTVGLAVTLLPIFWLSYLGLPVIEFARIFTCLLFVTSIAFLCWQCPIIPIRYYWPFALILFLALLVSGYSLLKFGFSWLSYLNDDMVNYSLSALRFLHNGYFTPPDIQKITHGNDYSLYYWYMHGPGLNRAGSELLLSWVSAITGLLPDKIFMPLIVAMHLTLLSVAAALVYISKTWKTATFTVLIMLTFSAMLNLGIFYQLLAQECGLSLLSASTLLLLQSNFPIKKSLILLRALLTGIVVSALFMVYPEIVPILAITFLFYYFISFIKTRKITFSFSLFIGFTTIIVLIFMSTNLITFFGTLIAQLKHGFTAQTTIFPYFLVPTGLAEFWGFHAIGANYLIVNRLTIEIFIGAALLVIALIATVWLTFELYSVAVITLIMFGLGINLFIHHFDFGLFKITMYIQPFILSTLVVAWFKIVKHPAYRIFPFSVLLIAGLSGLHIYQKRAEGVGIFDVPGASKTNINVEFGNLLKIIPKSRQVILDTPAVELAKYQMIYLRGRDAYFPSEFFMGQWLNFGKKIFSQNYFLWHYFVSENTYDNIKKFLYTAPNTSEYLYFHLSNENKNPLVDRFEKESIDIDKNAVLIASTSNQSIFNRFNLTHGINQNFIALPVNRVRNYLIFINSDCALHYYWGTINLDLKDVSLYSLERDYFYPKETFAGVGRYLLLRVINPTKNMRLMIDATAALINNAKYKLPPGSVVGQRRELLSFIGRGSARIFSPLIAPQLISNDPYIMIDMGQDGYYYKDNKALLLGSYGNDVRMDYRKINLHVRNISLISEEQYKNLKPPMSLNKFPDDLANPDLEYSGIYEDGWISETSFFVLQQSSATTTFELKGEIPIINDKEFRTTVSILIDGKLLQKKELGVGDFDIKLNISPNGKHRRIDIRFSKTQVLPGDDGRIVAAKINFIGFAK